MKALNQNPVVSVASGVCAGVKCPLVPMALPAAGDSRDWVAPPRPAGVALGDPAKQPLSLLSPQVRPSPASCSPFPSRPPAATPTAGTRTTSVSRALAELSAALEKSKVPLVLSWGSFPIPGRSSSVLGKAPCGPSGLEQGSGPGFAGKGDSGPGLGQPKARLCSCPLLNSDQR